MNKFYNYPEAKDIVFCGDIHGEFNEIIYKICVRYSIRDSVIVFAGDCGFGFYKENYYRNIYNRVKKKLEDSNNWLVFIRGNHDDPLYYQEEKISYERFRCVPDYSIVSACGHNILCVGGATSIDREWRINVLKEGYWSGEAPVYDEESLLSIDRAIDIVVTHTCPSFCVPQEKDGIENWLATDQNLEADLAYERDVMDKIFFKLKELNHPLKEWYYGHFHFTATMEQHDTKFRLLDIGELLESYKFRDNMLYINT